MTHSTTLDTRCTTIPSQFPIPYRPLRHLTLEARIVFAHLRPPAGAGAHCYLIVDFVVDVVGRETCVESLRVARSVMSSRYSTRRVQRSRARKDIWALGPAASQTGASVSDKRKANGAIA